ncbi:MAG: DNA polymerase I [Spirochaetales bacterium]|nr:DNA polymerase I [Spirochaetales bacterium]
MKNLVIVDAHSFIYKFYFSVGKKPLITTKNEDVTILHMFITKLISIEKNYNPTHMVICFDEKGPTFRNEIYENYKANRDKSPEEINRQTPILKNLLSELGYKILSEPGYEADDFIAASSLAALKKGFEVKIFSQDKDLLQLVQDNVVVISMKKAGEGDIIYDEKQVELDWGIKPNQMVDLLSLMGDSSDNIPGVKGIGEKTALQLIQKYGNCEQLLKYLHTISSESIRNKIKDGIESLKLSRIIVDLKNSTKTIELSEKLNPEEWVLPKVKNQAGLELLKNYELKQLYEIFSGQIFEGPYEYTSIDSSNYFLVDNKEKLENLFDYLKNYEIICIDTETTGIDQDNLDILGVSFSCEENIAYYVDVRDEIFREVFFTKLKNHLINKKKFIGHNLKYDYKVLRKFGVTLEPIYFDTIIAAMLCGMEGEKLSMDDLAKKYLRYLTIHYEDVVKDKKKTLNDYPIEDVKNYSCEDADITLRLFNFYKPKIEENNFTRLFYDIEMPLLPILAEMELDGILVDKRYFEDLDKEVSDRLYKIKGEIFELAGKNFLINSPKQLAQVLFEDLKIPPVKKTKTGLSTDEQVLDTLADTGYPIAQKLVEYRKLDKLRGTYILPTLSYIKKDGRIHTNYKQAFVSTGRLSSVEPNLQNIPAFTEMGINIRRGFIAAPGYLLLSFDYSQIELRVLAYFSADKNLIKAFSDGIDIHSSTASILFKKDISQITQNERKIAKTINFGVIYGLSAFGLKQQLGISQAEAQSFITNYFANFSTIKDYINNYMNLCEQRGYADTYFGRKRYIPQLKSANKTDKDAAKRAALNTQIQGTAAEIMKKGMIDVVKVLNSTYKEEKREKVRLLLQVHDELIFEVREDLVEPVAKKIKKTLESVMQDEKNWNIPLEVNSSFGKSWDLLK